MRVAATVVLMASLIAAVPPAGADGRRGTTRGEFHGSRHFDGHRFHAFRHRPFFPFFLGSSIVVVPPLLTAPDPVYWPPTVVHAAPPVYAAAPGYAPPSPPPLPRVVEFPGGRYELRGDGFYTPYSWVWIPNPPAAAPVPPPPTAPPPSSSPDPGPRLPPSRTARLFRWTDEQGVTTWTDSLEKVPPRYRAGVSQLAP